LAQGSKNPGTRVCPVIRVSSMDVIVDGRTDGTCVHAKALGPMAVLHKALMDVQQCLNALPTETSAPILPHMRLAVEALPNVEAHILALEGKFRLSLRKQVSLRSKLQEAEEVRQKHKVEQFEVPAAWLEMHANVDSHSHSHGEGQTSDSAEEADSDHHCEFLQHLQHERDNLRRDLAAQAVDFEREKAKMSSAVSKLELQKLELEQELTDSVAMFDYESSVRIEERHDLMQHVLSLANDLFEQEQHSQSSDADGHVSDADDGFHLHKHLDGPPQCVATS